MLRYICVVSKAISTRLIFAGRRSRRGGVCVLLEQKVETKDLMIDLVLVYYLDEKGVLIVKL